MNKKFETKVMVVFEYNNVEEILAHRSIYMHNHN